MFRQEPKGSCQLGDEMKIGITFEFEQYYLPTKRHKNPLKRKMVTCRDIDVHFIDEKDFPVAIRVTDFDVLSHNWEDETESKYDTLEYRFDGKHLYEEPRSLSGSDKGELVFSSGDAFMEHIRHHFSEKLYDYLYDYCEEKQYKEGVSVIVGDDIDARVERLQKFADQYLISNGKVWKKCGQPYYKVQTFGLGYNHGGTGFFIEWAYEETISKDYFLATQRELALKDFTTTASDRGDTDSIKHNDSEKRNIEILIPEAYTLERDLESEKYPGYMWSDRNNAYVKEYGDIREAAHKDVYLINFESSYDRYIARVCVDNKYVFTWKEGVWMALGLMLADLKDISFKDIKKIGNLEMDIDLLKWITDKEVSA